MDKTPYTLKDDIEHVLSTGEGWSDEISRWVADDIAKSLSRQFTRSNGERKGTLRFSNLGTPCDRKLWYTVNKTTHREPLSASTLNKFVFGDITESYMLGLAQAGGHHVTGLQSLMVANGIKGSRDCVIDGMLFDVKSASSRSFDKFKRGQLREDDPFGYISQLSSYLYASQSDPLVTEKSKAGFLVFDKQFGHVCVDIYDLSEELETKGQEIDRKKEMVKSEELPKREYEPVPDGKSGNMKLATPCGYCDFKYLCWPEVRTFLYANGPKYLTKVNKTPNVHEVGGENF